MKKDTEINELLNDQKTILKKIDSQHQLLLTSESGTDKYSELKKNLGWDDTDKTIKNEYNKILELKQITEENVDKSILNNESIWNYCIKNNYVLVNVKGYKGQIPVELLEAIDNYTKENSVNLDSDYNLGNLFLLCKFTDVVNSKNDKIDKSKRYKKGELPKIILLEREVKGNSYKEDHYKIIFEIGNKTPISNFINSIFKTHTKTINFFHHILAFGGVYFLVALIGLLASSFGKVTSCNINWAFGEFLPVTLNIITIILLFKIILPTAFQGGEDSLSLNTWHDHNYDRVDKIDNTELCNTSWLAAYRSLYIFNKNKIRIKVHLSFYIMLFSFILIALGVVNLNRILILNKQDVTVVQTDDNIQTTKLYQKDSPFTYKVTTKVVDLNELKRLAEEKALNDRKDSYNYILNMKKKTAELAKQTLLKTKKK